MALTNKLTAIANAIRSKSGDTALLTLDGMVTAINNLRTVFYTQTKTVTLSESAQNITPDADYDGLSQVSVPGISPTYVGSGVTRQAAKTVTPTTAIQTAVSTGKYTTGDVKVGAIPSEYIIPSGSETKTENGTYDVKSLAELIVNVSGGGGGLPSGFAAIATGTYTYAEDATTSKKTITHNMGVIPDLVLFWYPGGNIAVTYTMLYSLRCTSMGFRSSAYNVFNGYHGNSTTSVTTSNTNGAGIGVQNFTATTFQVSSHSTSYYWRGGYTYNWVAIKFS